MSFYKEKLKDALANAGIEFEEKGKTSFSFKRNEDEKITETTSKEEKYERTLKCIKRHFKLDNDTDFDEYFRQATSGSGNEAEKIDAIWSSSLLSLLFFYIAIKNGGVKFDKIHYTKCFFEFMNPVLCNHPYYNKPSNIDCVLMSEDEKHLLFIESKFIEYVRDVSKKCELSDKYARDGEPTAKLYECFKEKLESKESHYYYGVKQMITHYSGLYNFLNSDCPPHKKMMDDCEKRKVIDAYTRGANVAFIEIVYDISEINEEYQEYLNDYKKIQNELHNQMDKQLLNSKVLNNGRFKIYDLITYQRFLADTNAKISDMVKRYYSFNE